MGLFSKDIKTMDDLCVHLLQDMFYVETQIVKSLPKMIDNATNAELKRGLQGHLQETEKQIERLNQVFAMLEKSAKGTRCPAIDGIIEETQHIMGEVEDRHVLDAAIIASGQAVEHYEITRYGALVEWFKELGRADVARLLTQSLNEEKAADRKLTAIAEKKVNPRAEGRPAKRRAAPTRRAKTSRGSRPAPRTPTKKAKKGRSSSRRSA
jgi:ferritin-like metal-binding protein YciE